MKNETTDIIITDNGQLMPNENASLQLEQALNMADSMVRMQHLATLENLDIIPMSSTEKRISPENKVRLLNIGCLTYDENEDVFEKLAGVFGAIANYDASAVFILRHDGEKVNLYMGTACENPQILSMVFGTFERALKGNFPGCITDVKTNDNNTELLSSMFDYDDEDSIAIASISTMASRRGSDPAMYLQGIEKLVDGMKGIPFDLVVLASALSNETISMMRSGYETLYTQLAPFYKQNATMSVSDTSGFSKTVSESISQSLSMTTGTTSGTSHTTGTSKSTGYSREKADGKAKAVTALGLAGSVVASLVMGNPYGMFLGSSVTQSIQTLTGTKPGTENTSESGHTDTSTSSGTSETQGKSDTNTQSESTTDSDSRTTGKTMSYTMEDRTIGTLLQTIDKHLERLSICEGNGAYRCAAYLIAADRAAANMGASLYRSLLSGNDPLANVSYVNVWQESGKTEKICEYVKYMKHPRFMLINSNNTPVDVTPATVSPSPELPLHFSWPRKSLPGLTVATHAEFARDIIKDADSADNTIKVGNIYHMGNIESCGVTISSAELRKHLFVAGAPGSGKSNFCYVLLNRLTEAGVKFMVIEPAKGEYASVFGGRDDVNVFGTNSSLAPMLRINPFEFPEGVHLLEHLDRIIEVFNASWPMSAAMPALLKEGLEASYKSCGWNLETGECMNSRRTFPTFRTLIDILPALLKQTEYSQEVQGNYIGSLVTRVKSMTNGICGKVFCGESIDDKTLFDSNTIIDISRLGSAETKSLIMGIMIIRMQEYRSCNRNGINEELQHVTLLEEAHHLLRQTSGSQSMESANLRGMSVEILTNAIAEMRTYGEGFIIADQTPSIMSEAVIGNTSTKVIFKLPNIKDRIPMGNAVALNDAQINEVARLETGIAVMHQSHWIEPVLCKVDYYSEDNFKPLAYIPNSDAASKTKEARAVAVKLLLAKKKDMPAPSTKECADALKNLNSGSNADDAPLVLALENYIDGKEPVEWGSPGRLCVTLRRAFNPDPLFTNIESIEEFGNQAKAYLLKQVTLDDDYMNTLVGLLIMSCKNTCPDARNLFIEWVGFVNKNRNQA